MDERPDNKKVLYDEESLSSDEGSPLLAEKKEWRNWKGGGKDGDRNGGRDGSPDGGLRGEEAKDVIDQNGADDSWILKIGTPRTGRVSVSLQAKLEKEEALI